MPPRPKDQSDPIFDLDGLVGYNLKRAYIAVQTHFRAALGADGLSARVFSALSFVIQMPNITQSELARRLGVERSGLVAIVDDLEQRGALERTHVPGDRRVQALRPTEAGKALYQQTLATIRAHEARYFQHFTDDELQTLLALLRKARSDGGREER